MPFLFAYTSILKVGWNFNFFLTVFDCVIALVAWGAALEGHLFRKTSLWERIFLLIAALGLLHEGITTDIIGLIAFAIVILVQKLYPGRKETMNAQLGP